MKRHLYALTVSVWDMDDYIDFRDNNRSCNPAQSANLLFASATAAEEYAMTIDSGSDIYNECSLSECDVDEETILELTGYETMDEFDAALNDTYAADPTHKTFGYDEKARLAYYIIEEDGTPCKCIDCANYDIDKSIDGAIVVIWSWQTYIGYARKCEEVRYVYFGETEADLCKRDHTFVPQMDVVMTKDEVEASDDIRAELRERLLGKDWKWTNPSFVEFSIENC